MLRFKLYKILKNREIIKRTITVIRSAAFQNELIHSLIQNKNFQDFNTPLQCQYFTKN
jgi:hypothetical protein